MAPNCSRGRDMVEQQAVTMSRSQYDFMRKYLPADKVSMSISDFFSLFGDNTRVRILSALAINDLCVGDLAMLLSVNQSTVSHQLKLMKDARVLDCRRNGKVITYYIVNPFINDVMMLGVDNYSREKGQYSVLD